MARKKKHKKKKSKSDGPLAFAFAIVAQALGQVLGDAVQVAAERLADAEDKPRRALRKKKRDAVDSAQAVTP